MRSGFIQIRIAWSGDAHDLRLAGALHALQRIEHVDVGVVGDVVGAVAVVLARTRAISIMIDDDFFCTDTPSCVHRGRQLRQREVDAVLHLHLRDVGVGVEREVDGQRQLAGGRAGRRHVEHVVDAVDLRLDRRGDRIGERLRVGAGVGRRHRDLHRRDGRVLLDRQHDHRDQRRRGTRMIETTAAKIGRSMKKRENTRASGYLRAPPSAGFGAGGCGGGRGCRLAARRTASDLSTATPGRERQRAVDDDPVAGARPSVMNQSSPDASRRRSRAGSRPCRPCRRPRRNDPSLPAAPRAAAPGSRSAASRPSRARARTGSAAAALRVVDRRAHEERAGLRVVRRVERT